MRSASIVRFALAVLVALCALPSNAQTGAKYVDTEHNKDYYSSLNTSRLRTVEAYHLRQGEGKMRAARYIAAREDFDFILDYYPNHPQALMLMAELCETWKSPRCDVNEYFSRAIARNPNVAATYVIIGIHQGRTKQGSAAIESYKRALAIDPDSVNANYNIALAYLDSGQYQLANEHAQKAYALGTPPAGLRDRLKRGGYWQELSPPAPEAKEETRPGEPASSMPETAPSGGSLAK